MAIISIIAAGVASWIFGAIWYMALSKPWMAATGLTEEDVKATGPLPYIISLIGSFVVAGMMSHIFYRTGIDSFMGGLMVGIGLGAGVALPWMVNNILYGRRDKALLWLDGVFPVVGCAIIGVVLTLF